MRRDHRAHTDEDANNLNAGTDSGWTIENAGGHHGSVLGEDRRERPPAAVASAYGRKLRPQVRGLLGCQPETEVLWKAPGVPFDLLVKALHRHAIHASQISIGHHPHAADAEDTPRQFI